MRLLVDTNVIIDFLAGSDDKSFYAAALLSYAESGDEDEFVSASAVTDIAYIINKSAKERNRLLPEEKRKTTRELSFEVQDKIRTLYNVLHFLPVTDQDIDDALRLRWVDFEDAVQYSVAKNNDIDAIITNNTKDYKQSEIPIYTPSEYVTKKQEKAVTKQEPDR